MQECTSNGTDRIFTCCMERNGFQGTDRFILRNATDGNGTVYFLERNGTDLLGTVRQLARVQRRHVWSVNPENIQKLSAQKIAQGAESVQQVGPGLMAT